METLSAAILGTVCCDEIQRPGEKSQYGFGGIYYNIVTLGQLFGEEGTVYPICKIGELDYESILDQFTRYPVICTDYVQKYPGRNNTVTLKYYSPEERVEYSTHLPKPFTINELIPLPDVKLLLVNFISGIEMRYRTFQALRKRLKIPLYVDMHSIFLGFKRNGERIYLRNRDWSHWHEIGDIVQMNRTEAQILAGRTFEDEEEYIRFGKYLLEKGAKIVLITKGSEGVLLLWKSGNRLLDKSIPAYRYGNSREPTGCGDVFSSAYVYRHLQGADPPEAAGFACKVAGVRAAHGSSAELHNLREKLIYKGIL